MAFTTRSKRMGPIGEEARSPLLGPGSYLGQAARSVTLSYAPFSSTSDRWDGVDTATRTPGPGTYGVEQSMCGSMQSSGASSWRGFSAGDGSIEGSYGINRRSSILAPGPSRFDIGRQRSITPGPGAYSGPLSWITDRRGIATADSGRGGSRHRMVVFTRAITAPSVPAKHQSYGYDDSPDTGELVMQRPPDGGYSGTHGDLPGPGAYHHIPSESPAPDRPGPSFSKALGRHLVHGEMKVPENPGPGYYEPDEGRKEKGAGAKSGRRPSSMFVSRSNRLVEDLRSIPGPGSYSALAREPARGLPTALDRPFGSSVARAYEVDARTLRSAPTPITTPGPGAYDVGCGGGGRRGTGKAGSKRWGPGAGVGLIVPFSTTSDRFDDNSTCAPGPGAYKDETQDLASAASRARVTEGVSKGGFGSRSDRFNWQSRDGGANAESNGEAGLQDCDSGVGRLSSSDCNSPQGPRRKPARRKLPAGTSGFASQEDRFKGSSTLSPPPGAYQLADTWPKPAVSTAALAPSSSNLSDLPARPDLAIAGPAGTSSPAVVQTAPPSRQSSGGARPLTGSRPSSMPQAMVHRGTTSSLQPNAVTLSRPHPGFSSTVSRFGAGRANTTPGPGQYSAEIRPYWEEDQGREGPLPAPGHQGFLSKTGRFQDLENRVRVTLPGPGAYNGRDPYDSLVKRSFNVTVDGVGPSLLAAEAVRSSGKR